MEPLDDLLSSTPAPRQLSCRDTLARRLDNRSSTAASHHLGMPTLSAPRVLTFVASAVLIGLAVANLYTKAPMVGRAVIAHRQWFFIGAYALLALGVTTRSL